MYIDPTGDYAGIDADIAREACKRAGIRPQFVDISWNDRDRLSGLRNRSYIESRGDRTLTVSASFGVATAEMPGCTLAEICNLADHNMYQEKREVRAREADCWYCCHQFAHQGMLNRCPRYFIGSDGDNRRLKLLYERGTQ